MFGLSMAPFSLTKSDVEEHGQKVDHIDDVGFLPFGKF